MVPKSLAPGQTCFQLLRPTSQLPAKLSPWPSAGTFHSPSSFHLQMLSSYTVPHARKHRHPSVQNFRVTPPSDLLPPPVSSQPTGCLRLQILLLIQISRISCLLSTPNAVVHLAFHHSSPGLFQKLPYRPHPLQPSSFSWHSDELCPSREGPSPNRMGVPISRGRDT